jgi:transposase-like protein
VGRPIGPRKVHRYSVEFKLTAVKLSSMPGVQVQMVADALDIHSFMLSRWRKEARDGILRGRVKRVDMVTDRVRSYIHACPPDAAAAREHCHDRMWDCKT